MCGINGKINLDGKPVFESEILVMNQAIKHRGPDDEGVYTSDNVGLGNVRLAIIDLSPKGHQPIISHDKRLVITYNGEIYNYLENRQLLESRGYSFVSNTDTETILYLYREFGTECLKYLKGMFAFAIWDAIGHKLFAARDPFGKKPFKYYLDDGHTFIFSSEIKGLFASNDVPKELDLQAIDSFLSLRYVPSPRTGFKNIKKLPQGHFLIVEHGKLSIKRYFSLDFSQTDAHAPKSYWIHNLQKAVEKAVKDRVLASDVPVGTFLSGGFDSSVVAALAVRHSAVKTFSVGYEGELKENELAWAKKVANYIHSEHHELVVKPRINEDLSEIIRAYEEPFADPAMVPVYYLARATSPKVKVTLTGDGGDEVFLGYSKISNFAKYHRYFNLPKSIRRLLSQIAPTRQARFILDLLTQNPSDAYLSNMGCWDRETVGDYYFDKDYLYTDYLKDTVNLNFTGELFGSIFKEASSFSPLNQAAYLDFESYLPDNNLVKADLGFMAWGLEGRYPLLDDDLISLISRMPPSIRMGKKIFKEAFKSTVPSEIMARRKQGFSVPLNNWFRNELKDCLWSELLSSGFISHGLFKKESLERVLLTQRGGNNNYDNHLWCLMSLSQWFKVWEL